MNRLVGYAAAVLGLGAIAVVWTDRAARLVMGALLGVLVVLLVAASRLVNGFRFVFAGDEGELVFLLVGLGLVVMGLLLPLRILVYACSLAAAVVGAFIIGVSRFSARCSALPEDGECDLGFVEGLLFAGVASVLVLMVIAAVEVTLARRRRSA